MILRLSTFRGCATLCKNVQLRSKFAYVLFVVCLCVCGATLADKKCGWSSKQTVEDGIASEALACISAYAKGSGQGMFGRYPGANVPSGIAWSKALVWRAQQTHVLAASLGGADKTVFKPIEKCRDM